MYFLFRRSSAFVSSSCRSVNNESSFINSTESRLKILAAFGYLDTSHFYVFRSLLEELERTSHDLTVLSRGSQGERDVVCLKKFIRFRDQRFRGCHTLFEMDGNYTSIDHGKFNHYDRYANRMISSVTKITR